MGLIRGEAVTVVRPRETRDHLGEPVASEPSREEVGNVVVAPGPTSDLDASRPEGVKVAYTLCFPKSYGGSIKGCSVEVRGKAFAVIGDPQRYTEANTPGDWNMTAEVEAVDG